MPRRSSALVLCVLMIASAADATKPVRSGKTTGIGLKERIARGVTPTLIGAAFAIPLAIPVLGGFLDAKVQANVRERIGVEVRLGNDHRYRVTDVANSTSPLRFGDVVLMVNGENLSPWRGNPFGARQTASSAGLIRCPVNPFFLICILHTSCGSGFPD